MAADWNKLLIVGAIAYNIVQHLADTDVLDKMSIMHKVFERYFIVEIWYKEGAPNDDE
jgi:hypothetical protein